MTKHNIQIFGVSPFSQATNYHFKDKQWNIRCRIFICLWLNCSVMLFWCPVLGRMLCFACDRHTLYGLCCQLTSWRQYYIPSPAVLIGTPCVKQALVNGLYTIVVGKVRHCSARSQRRLQGLVGDYQDFKRWHWDEDRMRRLANTVAFSSSRRQSSLWLKLQYDNNKIKYVWCEFVVWTICNDSKS